MINLSSLMCKIFEEAYNTYWHQGSYFGIDKPQDYAAYELSKKKIKILQVCMRINFSRERIPFSSDSQRYLYPVL